MSPYFEIYIFTSAVLPEVPGPGSGGPVLTQDTGPGAGDGTGAGLRSVASATETSRSGVFLAPPSVEGPGFLAAPRDALPRGARGGALTFEAGAPEGPGVAGPERNERNPLGFLRGQINHEKTITIDSPIAKKNNTFALHYKYTS